MNFEEQLWRNFQSRYTRLSNKLSKNEKNSSLTVLQNREELCNVLDFASLEIMGKERMENVLALRNVTKDVRNKIIVQEKAEQVHALQQFINITAKKVYEQRSTILEDPKQIKPIVEKGRPDYSTLFKDSPNSII